jgi:Mg-chelatase subunit ChlD
MQRLKIWALAVAGVLALILSVALDERERSSHERKSHGADAARPSARVGRPKAVAFIVDTSGSMAQPLEGKRRIDCAKDSLLRILELYRMHDDEAHDLDAGLWCFGRNELENPLPMGAFSHERLRRAVSALDSPGGTTAFGTRIGTAIDAAAAALAARRSTIRAIVFLTDGENTAGPDPEDVWREVLADARSSGAKPPELYLVAFNVERSRFAGLQALGAHVEEANDEAALGRVFADYSATILEEPLPDAAPAAKETAPAGPR